MRTHVTVVGGGIGGLVAAISCREQGFDVTLHEARNELGGRARTTRGAYRANWGPHVIYSDGPLWAWLDERGLARPAHAVPAVARIAFRVDGRAGVLPPRRVVTGILRLRRHDAPVDQPFSAWAAEQLGEEAAARRIANAMGVVTFDHDPGRLSAAFVNERLRRVTALPSKAKYLPGGWATLVDRLTLQATRMGVTVVRGSAVDQLPEPPVILAVPLDTAATLLADDTLRWTGTRTALLDVGLTRRRLDPFILSDLDAAGWVERFSVPDPSLAPEHHSLLQGQVGMRPDETPDEAVTRLETLIDTGYHDWRARETWRRRVVITDESGALDLPGTTWRDRPAVDRGDDIYVVGDMVAAPGVLSEVTFNAAIAAVSSISAKRQHVRAA